MDKQPTPSTSVRGQPEISNGATVLKAGDLEVKVIEGSVRGVTWAGNEAVARIYVGVRVEDWVTVPMGATTVHVEQDSENFEARISSRHLGEGAEVQWDGILEGRSDGRLRFAVVAHVLETAMFNRIGLCLLHRSRLMVGGRLVVHRVGRPQSMSIPSQIAPQWVVRKREFGMTEPFRRVTLETPSGLEFSEAYSGEMFEVEDERNFGDGFFKIYGPPTRDGYPRQRRAGSAVKQSVTIQFVAHDEVTPVGVKSSRSKTVSRSSTSIEIRSSEGGLMPPVGVDWRALGPGIVGAKELRTMRDLSPSHVRFDIKMSEQDWSNQLMQALSAASASRTHLECALWFDDIVDVRLQELAVILSGNSARVARVLIHSMLTGVPSSSLMEMVFRLLSREMSGLPLFATSSGGLWELNEERPRYSPGLGVAYPTNPGMHLGDDEAAFEGLFGQGDGVTSARSLYPDAPVAVTPVTIGRMPSQIRSGVSLADESEILAPPDDARLDTTTGAAWIGGSIGALVRAGAASLTYADRIYGVDPRPFAHVLAAACAMEGYPLLECGVEREDLVRIFGVRRGLECDFIVANLSPESVGIDFKIPADFVEMSGHVLNEQSLSFAMAAPGPWRRSNEHMTIRAGLVQDQLGAHAVAFYRAQRTPSGNGPVEHKTN